MYNNDQENQFDFLEWLEEEWDCAGWCTLAPRYMFTNVDNGIPEDSCMTSYRQWVLEDTIVWAVIFLAIGFLTFINIYTSAFIEAEKSKTESAEYGVVEQHSENNIDDDVQSISDTDKGPKTLESPTGKSETPKSRDPGEEESNDASESIEI